MNKEINALRILIGFLGLCWLIPFCIKHGWNTAENRTKKVCDMCFRDIKKFNKEMKKNK